MSTITLVHETDIDAPAAMSWRGRGRLVVERLRDLVEAEVPVESVPMPRR